MAKKSAAAVADAISRLAGGSSGFQPLTAAAPKGAKPGTVSSGRPAETTGSTSAAGGWDEEDYDQREYYSARQIRTTDGVFVFIVEPIKSILLAGNVRGTFKEPTA